MFYQKRTGLDEFSQEIATLTDHYGRDALAGMILDPDLLVVVKLYDQGGVMVPVPAIKLIDFSNQQQEDWLGKVKTVTFLAATVGVGGIGASGIVGWADTITVALSAGSLFVNAYRDEIAKTPLGQLFLEEWDIAEGIAEYYNWGRLGVDGLRLIHAKVSTALENWRQKTPAGLAERETIATVQQHTEPWLDAVKQAETPAAEKYLQEHPPNEVKGKPGSREAHIDGGHELKEVSGGLGCEFWSPGGTPVHCNFGPRDPGLAEVMEAHRARGTTPGGSGEELVATGQASSRPTPGKAESVYTEAGKFSHTYAEPLRKHLPPPLIPSKFAGNPRVIPLSQLPDGLIGALQKSGRPGRELTLGVTSRVDRATGTLTLHDANRRIIYEIKPDSVDSIEKGLSRGQEYANLANDKQIGGGTDWDFKVVVYNARAARALIR